MKTFYTFLILNVFAIHQFKAQTAFVKDSLSVSTTIKLDEIAQHANYQVQLKKIITDSRCPKDVMCIRAGEATVLVGIYKEGKHIKDREIIIHASGYVMEETNLVFRDLDQSIYGVALTPYPKTEEKIPDHTYELEVVFQPRRSQ
ncbi:MAG: hypothetical protein GYB32_01275 [Algicola sp.]|nr:hypothetical protein [Algicola sp.]